VYRRQGELKMALSTINNEFVFPNGNKIKFECENCNSYSDVKIVYYNDKKVRSFNGVCKAINFYNKKNELDGCVIKVKNNFNKHYYIVVNPEKTFLRIGGRKCFELIPTLEKDKSTRIKELEKLKV
jgi:hypothetical protein